MKNEKPFVYLGKNLIKKLIELDLEFYSSDLKDYAFILQETTEMITIISVGGEIKQYRLNENLDRIIPIDLTKSFKRLFLNIFPPGNLIKLIIEWKELGFDKKVCPLIDGQDVRKFYVYKIDSGMTGWTYETKTSFFICPKYMVKRSSGQEYSLENEGKAKLFMVTNTLQHSVVIDIPDYSEINLCKELKII